MDIGRLLKEHGLKVTPQRRAILTVMQGTKGFISAQELFVEVKNILPGTNFSTIYRNLEALLAREILCSVTPDETGSLFRLREDEGHHHHALCKSCGASIPMDCPMEEMYRQLRDKGFTPVGHTLEIYGYCRECKDGKKI